MDYGPTQKQPLVSVFLPVYNQRKFIEEAIESALDQRYDNLEIVIGDDCSTDGTWRIVQKYQEAYPDKIKAFRNSENLGITGNCNKVLPRCQGEYIAFHAGDDVFCPGKIKKQIALMESDPLCVLSYHDVEVFDSDTGKVIKRWNSGDRGKAPITGSISYLSRKLVECGTSFMAALSVVVRREAISSLSYDQRVPIASDWLMWIEVSANNSGNVHFVSEVLSRYRRHNSNITDSVKGDNEDTFVSLALVEAKYPELIESVRVARGYQYYRIGVSYIRNNEPALGRRQLVCGARIHIFSWKWIGWWFYSWWKQASLAR